MTASDDVQQGLRAALKEAQREVRRIEGLLRTREVDEMKKAGVRFFHFHDLNSKLVASIAAQDVGRGQVRFSGVFYPGSRRMGREIAYGRLLKGHSALLPLGDFQDQLHTRHVVWWLGKPHAATGYTHGRWLWENGLRPPRQRETLPLDEEVQQEISEELAP